MFREYEKDGIKLIAFDLQKPLPAQLKKADEYLRAIQSELFDSPKGQRDHRKKWAQYLRILDAKAAGATANEIWCKLKIKPRSDAKGGDPDRFVAESIQQAKEITLRFKNFLKP